MLSSDETIIHDSTKEKKKNVSIAEFNLDLGLIDFNIGKRHH